MVETIHASSWTSELNVFLINDSKQEVKAYIFKADPFNDILRSPFKYLSYVFVPWV